jgi:hypothetical protein
MTTTLLDLYNEPVSHGLASCITQHSNGLVCAWLLATTRLHKDAQHPSGDGTITTSCKAIDEEGLLQWPCVGQC